MANESTIDVDAKYVTQTVSMAHSTTVPVSTSFVLGERMLEELSVFFAPGHAGLSGFRINYAGVTLLPWNQPNAFVVGNNERRAFRMGIHVSSPLTIQTVNNDKGYAHAIVFEAKLTELLLVGEDTPITAPLPLAIAS